MFFPYTAGILVGSMVCGNLVLAATPSSLTLRRAEPDTAIKSRRVRGQGGFGAPGRRSGRPQQWKLDVRRRGDNRIEGKVELTNSPLMSVGTMRGRIQGQALYGTIHDEEGRRVADFDGVVAADSISGSYTDRTGESGSWYWSGRLPR